LRARLQSQLLLHVRADNLASWDVFVWLLEDWCLARSLISRHEALSASVSGRDDGDPAFRLVLRAPEAVWREGLLEFLSMPAGEEVAAMANAAARAGAPEEIQWRRVHLVIEEESEEEAQLCHACVHEAGGPL
jgi:hypothetical protein